MQKDKQPTSMTPILLTDILFMTPFGLLAALGIIALGVLSLFIGVCGLIYIVKSFFFSTASQIVGGLALSVMILGITALFGYIEYLLGKSTFNGIKSYLKDRKQAVAIIKKSQEILKENQDKKDNKDFNSNNNLANNQEENVIDNTRSNNNLTNNEEKKESDK